MRRPLKPRTRDIPVEAIQEFFVVATMFLDGHPATRWTDDYLTKAKQLNEWLKEVEGDAQMEEEEK